MARRPNLAKYYCEKVEMWAHLELTYSLAKQLLNLSYGRTDKSGRPSYALFGDIYKPGGVPHVARGIVHLVEPKEQSGEYHVGLIYAKEKMPRPPRPIARPSVLLEAITEEAKRAEFHCYVDFLYPPGCGWISVIELPQPLSKETGQKEEDFTHLESLELSKRTQDKLQYSVQADQIVGGRLEHRIHLRHAGEVSEQAIHEILKRATEISRLLLKAQG